MMSPLALLGFAVVKQKRRWLSVYHYNFLLITWSLLCSFAVDFIIDLFKQFVMFGHKDSVSYQVIYVGEYWIEGLF